jgi:hypothetical protein
MVCIPLSRAAFPEARRNISLGAVKPIASAKITNLTTTVRRRP